MGSPTKPPESPFEALTETVRHWKEQLTTAKPECSLRMETFETRWHLAINFFDEEYDYFEIFMLELGMNFDLLEIFKACVFNEVIRYDFLQAKNVLAKSIAGAIDTFYEEPYRSKMVVQLEAVYDRLVGKKTSDRLDPVAGLDLPALIQNILKTKPEYK